MTSTARQSTHADKVEDAVALLDLIATHDVGPALADLEDLVERVRSSTLTIAAARRALRATSPEVLRDAIRFRAGRAKAPR